MTLIVTAISKCGIIQASDSNLTAGALPAGAGQKVFDLPFAHGALALAGSYQVGTQRMDNWMTDFIDSFQSSPPSLEQFAHELSARLSKELTDNQRQGMTLMHLAGYGKGQDGIHPEFYFVRNIRGIDQTGSYIGPGTDTCDVSEDFWTRDYLAPATRTALETGGWQGYFNGFPEGRIAYLGFSQMFTGFLGQAWSNPQWKFRAPKSLEEVAAIVELEIKAVEMMFRSSDYPALYIGGEVQLRQLAPPGPLVI
jgi:hypothetical protein